MSTGAPPPIGRPAPVLPFYAFWYRPDYWLDVHDPALQLANAIAIPGPIGAVLIAAIIEIGLLNSTYVISLQTSNSRGSRWVPYEYGRAKQRLLRSTQAASWFDAGVVPDPGGDSLLIGKCA